MTLRGTPTDPSELVPRHDLDDLIEESEHRFRTMADCAPVLLWMAGTDAMCDFFNQVWLDFTGRAMEQELGIGWAEGIHHEDFQRSVDTYLAAFNERREFKMVYRLRRRDGAFRFILDNGVPRFSPSGVFLGYIGSCVDITERVLAEQENARLVVALTSALRMREDFISIASHELKTPLTSLRLHVERLRKWATDETFATIEPDKLKRATSVSFDQVLRLEKLIDDMLVSTRLARESNGLERRSTDLGVLVRDTVERYAAEARSARCSIAIEADDDVAGHWDASRLEQIVVNLLSNSLKYASGSPVTIRIRDRGDQVGLSVADHGRGIAQEDQARIFGRFERAVPFTEISGMGLGLHIARQVAEAHGGTLTVTSDAGLGSTFELLIPRR